MPCVMLQSREGGATHSVIPPLSTTAVIPILMNRLITAPPEGASNTGNAAGFCLFKASRSHVGCQSLHTDIIETNRSPCVANLQHSGQWTLHGNIADNDLVSSCTMLSSEMVTLAWGLIDGFNYCQHALPAPSYHSDCPCRSDWDGSPVLG